MHGAMGASKQAWRLGNHRVSIALSLSLFSLPPPPPSTLFYQQHEARGGRKGASERASESVMCTLLYTPETLHCCYTRYIDYFRPTR